MEKIKKMLYRTDVSLVRRCSQERVLIHRDESETRTLRKKETHGAPDKDILRQRTSERN